MEILFKNITKYSKEELERFQKFHNVINEKRYKTIIILYFIGFSLFFLLNCMAKNILGIIGILLIAIVLYSFYFKDLPNKKRKNNKKQENETFLFEFLDKELIIKTNNLNNSDKNKDKVFKKINNIKYKSFYKIYETEKNFYFYVDKDYSIILNKKGFESKNINEFRDFIKNKVKHKYKKIHRK